jgi:apolipoprotein N-acyltransferase
MWGVSFLIAWLGSIVNWAWENDFNWPAIRAGALGYAALVAAILLTGGLRLTFSAPQSQPVRVAALAVEPGFYEDSLGPVWMKLANSETLTDAELAQYRAEFETSNAELLARTRREAQAGAEIIVWGEAAALVLKADEADLVARAQAISQDEGVYVAMGVVAIHLDQKRPIENRLLLVEPSGAVEYGFSLVRPDDVGYSLAADYLGRRLASVDTVTATDKTIVAYVPTQGARTLYAQIGDVFAWASVVGAMVIAGLAVFQQKAQKLSEPQLAY